ncbi:MAG TPA: ABC transporter ATP-binding protein [Polyangia bacterium]|nr:ABC transporter ATP-binding protein [Polyangia bacterium]
MIDVRGVGKTYGFGLEAREVVRDCSFDIPPGRFTVMIGPSGAGKSTLIRLLAGFERPTTGEIRIDGKPIGGPGPDRQVVFQESALFPWMNTSENVLYGPKARGEMNEQTRRRARGLLEKVGLTAFGAKFPRQLSGGMQRRAELARAMVNDPALMILDEPFRGLDAMTRKLMLEYYARLAEEQRRTNFFVTTDVDEAIFLADQLLVMTHIPTRVRAVIEVDLPRPRELTALVADDRANRIKMQVLSLLHEEAMKSFAHGSARAAADFVDAYRRRVAQRASNS